MMNLKWGVSEHTSTDMALNLKENFFSQTFGEEWTNKKTEGNGCHGETYQEQEDDERIGLSNDPPLSCVHRQEDGHDGRRDQQENEVLGKPGNPV